MLYQEWKFKISFRFLYFCGLHPILLLQGGRKPEYPEKTLEVLINFIPNSCPQRDSNPGPLAEKTLEVLINFIPEASKILVPNGIRTQDPLQRKPAHKPLRHSTPLVQKGLKFLYIFKAIQQAQQQTCIKLDTASTVTKHQCLYHSTGMDIILYSLTV